MNIGIGNNRWVKFSRNDHGEWHGRGHGYRFFVTRPSDTAQWQCHVFHDQGPILAAFAAHKMKTAIQESTRLADVQRTEQSCPT